jgi:hypothetical protein
MRAERGRMESGGSLRAWTRGDGATDVMAEGLPGMLLVRRLFSLRSARIGDSLTASAVLATRLRLGVILRTGDRTSMRNDGIFAAEECYRSQ